MNMQDICKTETKYIWQISGGQSETSPAQRWNSLELVKGCYGPEDCVNDIAEIKFDRPVSIKVSDFFFKYTEFFARP